MVSGDALPINLSIDHDRVRWRNASLSRKNEVIWYPVDLVLVSIGLLKFFHWKTMDLFLILTWNGVAPEWWMPMNACPISQGAFVLGRKRPSRPKSEDFKTGAGDCSNEWCPKIMFPDWQLDRCTIWYWYSLQTSRWTQEGTCNGWHRLMQKWIPNSMLRAQVLNSFISGLGWNGEQESQEPPFSWQKSMAFRA